MSSIKVMVLLAMAALLLPGKSYSQEQLSLQEAIRIGLENNYDIKVVTTEQQLSENNATLGNAGFLPTIEGRVTRNFSQNDTRDQFSSNEPREINDLTNQSTVSGVYLNWTIFDGMGMFINYNRLKALEKSGKLFTKATIETTLSDITDSYYQVVRQARKISALQDAIAISEERVGITQAQFDVGVSAKVEILRAQVDYNTDRSEFLLQQEAFKNAKINLNQLLGRNPEADFVPTDSIVVDPSIQYEQLNTGLAANPTLQRFQLNREVAQLDLRSAQGLRLPFVNLTGGYVRNESEQNPAIIGQQIGTNFRESTGFNYGISLNLPIFNGFEIRRQTQNAKVAIQANTLAFEREQNRLQSEIARAYNVYSNRLQLLELEESNVKLAQENAAIALERYRLGLLTAIELREAQRNELVAANRLTDIQYEAKAAETQLRFITSTLLQPTTTE
ncbi:TolC family protein [Pontibacter arcticus]|uniref:TolC family protein n=1 Tax=Pontibacter arcticus TaxID=2080288 RepID=A0A364RD69_9BACT|nr:TolC family protein [Pontibacter arcticus]RAU82288.1 TolC family protein [Pontibacter arcticus]